MDSNIKFRNDLITYESLKKFGYKRYLDKSDLGKDAVWCKKIRDASGVKYIICFSEHDWTKFTNHFYNDTSFEPYVQFNQDDDNSVNVTYLQNDLTIDKIEDFFESIWIKMQFSYNELY